MSGFSVLLEEKRPEFVNRATDAYNFLVGLPKSVRPDDKVRTGIRVLVREIGTGNIVSFSVGEPSEMAMFFVSEKAVRSEMLGHLTSQQSENPDKMKFRGSVAFILPGNSSVYQASVSGLTADDDVAIAVLMLSIVFDISARNVCDVAIENGGHFPACLTESGHYLHDLVNKY